MKASSASVGLLTRCQIELSLSTVLPLLDCIQLLLYSDLWPFLCSNRIRLDCTGVDCMLLAFRQNANQCRTLAL